MLTATAAVAQSGIVSAIIYDDRGEPLKGATLLAENPEAFPPTLTTTSDDRGRVNLIGLRSGQWGFTVEYPGFQPSRFALPVRQNDRNRRPVLVRLERIPSIVLGGPLAGVDVEDLRADLTAADEALAAGNVDSAIARYRAALERAPGLPVINLQLGEAYRQKDDAAGAIAAFEALLASEPTHAAALYQLAEIHERQGQLDRARELYQRASGAEPAWAKPILRLALLARTQGDARGAEAQLKRVMLVDPQSPEAVQAEALLADTPR